MFRRGERLQLSETTWRHQGLIRSVASGLRTACLRSLGGVACSYEALRGAGAMLAAPGKHAIV